METQEQPAPTPALPEFGPSPVRHFLACYAMRERFIRCHLQWVQTFATPYSDDLPTGGEEEAEVATPVVVEGVKE